MNNLTPTEVVNEALIMCKKGPVEDITNPRGAEDRKASILYKGRLQSAVAGYPWPFLTTRKRLKGLEDNGDAQKGYVYRYELPEDYAYIWDFYYAKERYPQYGAVWNTAYYYPAYGRHGLLGGYNDNEGEILDNEFQTDLPEVYALYTRVGAENDWKKWTNAFKEFLLHSLCAVFAQSFSTEEESLMRRVGYYENKKKSDKTTAARENPRASQPNYKTQSVIVNRLRNR